MMSDRTARTDYIGYRKRLDDLCARLKAAGYQVESSQLDAYRQTFATNELLILENRNSELERKIPFPTFLNDFHESNELLEACAEFPDLSVPGLRDRLERVLSGTRALKQETPETGAPRNFLFELVMASTLKRAGYDVDLDRIEDVYFEISGVPCFMECKRVHSQGKDDHRDSYGFLNEIMVNILAGQFRSRAVQSHRLQFEHHESPARILCECLIDANPDLLPRRHRAGEEVRLDQFLREIQSHVDLRVLGLASGKPCIKQHSLTLRSRITRVID